MRKALITLTLLCLLAISAQAMAKSPICPECDQYHFQTMVPYSPASSAMWSGIAFTNTSFNPVSVRLDYVGGYNGIDRIVVPERGVFTYLTKNDGPCYITIRSESRLKVQSFMGNDAGMQGFVWRMYRIPGE